MLNTWNIIVIAAAITLVGCQAGSSSKDAASGPSAATETEATEAGGGQTEENTMDGENDGLGSETLNIRVVYRERMMIPPTSEIEVVLEDQGKMDVAAERIAETRTQAKGSPPYPITLAYDPARLTAQGTYAVRARIENAGQLMFTSTTFIPAFGVDGRTGSEVNDPIEILVERVARQPKPTGAASLTGTTWTLIELGGKPASKGAGGKAPNITLQGSESRISGFGGCNRLMGGYQLEGNEIAFPQLAMTMMACVDGMELERSFSKALGETTRYEIEGSTLTLFAADGTALAKFEAEG